jgi:dephospho-CoA kinase
LREKFGNNILGEAIAKKIKNVKKGLIILNGIRMWEEFKMIKKFGGRIIYITADSKIRWQRIQNRGEKKDDKISYQKFLKMEKAATEILIPKIGKKADYKIKNNGSVKDFHRNIKSILNKI